MAEGTIGKSAVFPSVEMFFYFHPIVSFVLGGFFINEMNRKSFIFYESWKIAISDLPDDIQLEIYQAITEYAINGNLIEMSAMARLAFSFIKQDIDRNAEKYDAFLEKQRVNGAKGGRPKKNQEVKEKTQKTQPFSEKPKKTQKTHNDDVDDNDNDDKDEDNIVGVKTPSLHSVCKNLFLEKFRQLFGEEYYWEAKDGANLNPIIKKIRFNREKKEMPIDDESISVAFSLFLDSITDKWLLGNFSIPNINSKFNEIISQIKNGRTRINRPTSAELEAAVEIGMALAAGR